MLEAKKNAWFERLFEFYNRYYLIHRGFHSVGVKGDLHPTVDEDCLPVIYIANHSSWWDGMLVFEAVRRLSRTFEHYMMMQDEQLSVYRFFRWLGAYGVDQQSYTGIKQSLQYTVDLLKRGRRVWIFPQGEIAALHQEAFHFQTGIGSILKSVGSACVVPVTLEYRMMYHPKPDASLRVGEPIVRDWSLLHRKQISAQLEELLLNEMKAHTLETCSARGIAEGYISMKHQRLSLHEKFAVLRGRAEG